MEICKHENCNNETEWVDEPEEYCRQCIGLMVDNYQKFLNEEKEVLV